MVRSTILTVALVFNGLFAQTAMTIVNRITWPVESSSAYASTVEEYTQFHEQQLYAAQIRASFCSSRAATRSAPEHFTGRLPADTHCIIHFNNGLKVPTLIIQSIDDNKLIVRDKTGRQQDILIACITQIEIVAADIATYKIEKGIPDSRGWLKNLLNKPRNYVLSLGWLTIEEKIELLQSRFMIA